MMDLRRLAETAAAARRQLETRRHQEEWMCSAKHQDKVSPQRG